MTPTPLECSKSWSSAVAMGTPIEAGVCRANATGNSTRCSVWHVKKRDSWGPAVAALTLGLFTIMVVTAFYLGIRGLL